MKLISLLPLAVALATATAIAQDTAQASRVEKAAFAAPASAQDSCPIGLAVDHADFFVEKRIDDARGRSEAMPPGGAVQRVHLRMSNHSTRKIVEVQLTVHGFRNKERTFTLVSASPDAVKRITLSQEIAGNGEASRDLSLRNFTALSTVEVNSIRYADGSRWTSTASGVCRVFPNSLMLVSAVVR